MKLTQYFLSAYKEQTFIIQEKSRALLYFLFIFLLFVPIAMITFFIIQPQGLFGTANITLSILLLTVIVCLYLLKK